MARTTRKVKPKPEIKPPVVVEPKEFPGGSYVCTDTCYVSHRSQYVVEGEIVDFKPNEYVPLEYFKPVAVTETVDDTGEVELEMPENMEPDPWSPPQSYFERKSV